MNEMIEEKEIDVQNISPSKINEYIGQTEVKENMKIFIEAAKMRGESLDHVLLYGPPGLGKTTMAYIIANELGVNIKTASGPSIEKSGDLAAILSSLEPGDVLFIDEIHRMPRFIEEILYPAMEDFTLDIVIGSEGQTRNIKVLNFEIDDDAAIEIARRSRGTPRIANKLFRRVRDFALVENKNHIDIDITNKALDRLKIDKIGLDETDKELILTIIDKFNGGPVGIETLATSLGEETSTIEDMNEPYLIQIGLLKRTNRGRIATEKAYSYFNKN